MATLVNGRIPDALLTQLGTDASGRPVLLQTQAAESLRRVARASGLTIGPSTISDSYRDYARQVAYYKNPPNSVGMAAIPGTSSHGLGLAIDARGSLVGWLAVRGQGYGWYRTIPAESWHFEYKAKGDTYASQEGFLMALSDQEQADLKQQVANIQAAVSALLDMFDADGELRGALHHIDAKTDTLVSRSAAPGPITGTFTVTN